ncbi:MAG: hypothetical protein R2706_05445 [Acidimicrobiales bacterium]
MKLARGGGRLEGVELDDGSLLPADAVMVGTEFEPRIEAFAPLAVAVAQHASGKRYGD